MFELFAQLTDESRKALFAALADSMRAGRPEIESEVIALNCLRTESVRTLLTEASVSVKQALEALGSTPFGDGTLEAFEHAVQSGDEAELARLPLPPVGYFASLGISLEARSAFDLLDQTPPGQPESGIPPAAIIAALLLTSVTLTEKFARAGIGSELFSSRGGV